MANLSNINNKFIVTDGGKVGIGITAPTGILHTDQTFSGYAPVTFKSSVTNQGQFVELITSTDEGSKYTGIESISLQTGNGWKVWGGGNNFGEMYLSVSGSHAIVIKNDLKVGIGTTAPDAKFQVQGNVKVGSASGASWTDAKDDVGGLDVFVGSGSNAFSVWDDNAQTIPRFLVSRAGNVGIGGAAGVKFEVYSGSLRVRGSSANLIELSNINGNTRAALGNTGNEGDLSLYRSNNVKTVYLSSYYNSYINPDGGNLGIGTTSPSQKLHVVGNVFLNGGSAYIASYNNTTNYQGAMRWSGLQLGNNGANRIVAGRTSTGGSFQFWTNNTNDASDHTVTPNGIMTMSMLNTGNVGIGTASPNRKLTIFDGSTNNYLVSAKWYKGSSSFNNPFIVIVSNFTNTSSYPQIVIKINLIGHGISANRAQFTEAICTYDLTNGDLQQTTISHKTVGTNAVSAGAFSVSGTSIGFTPLRQTNYDLYKIEADIQSYSATFNY